MFPHWRGCLSGRDQYHVFDYVYAALSSPSYRESYAEFMKTDFPFVPIIPSDEEFARLVPLGRSLREIHLLKSPRLDEPGITYPVIGNDMVTEIKMLAGNIYINESQYFGNVPQVVWDVYFGGYQPARKWLSERIGQKLSDKEIRHYQRVLKALAETHRVWTEIG